MSTYGVIEEYSPLNSPDKFDDSRSRYARLREMEDSDAPAYTFSTIDEVLDSNMSHSTLKEKDDQALAPINEKTPLAAANPVHKYNSKTLITPHLTVLRLLAAEIHAAARQYHNTDFSHYDIDVAFHRARETYRSCTRHIREEQSRALQSLDTRRAIQKIHAYGKCACQLLGEKVKYQWQRFVIRSHAGSDYHKLEDLWEDVVRARTYCGLAATQGYIF